MHRVLVAAAGCLLAIMAGAGCSSSVQTAKLTEVKGSVNLDGAPLAEGEISFSLPGLPPTLLEVKNGAYAGKAGVGENRVEIRAFKESAPIVMGTEKFDSVPVNYLPAKYNAESTLAAKVTAGDANDFKFEVSAQ